MKRELGFTRVFATQRKRDGSAEGFDVKRDLKGEQKEKKKQNP